MSVDNLLNAEELKTTAAKTLDQDDDVSRHFLPPLSTTKLLD